MLTRRVFIAAATALPVACNLEADALPTGRGPIVTPEDMGWTSASSPFDTAGIINSALEKAVRDGVSYYDNARRRIGGTIRLGGRVLMDLGAKQEWVADPSGNFDEIQNSGNGNRRQGAKTVFVDTSGARGSIIRGPLTLTGVIPKNMSLAERARIPAELVALTAARAGAASEMSYEALTIEGFGHAFWQANRREGGELILPYTRMQADVVVIRFCLQPIVTGTRSNGLDDAIFQILRMSRNTGVSILRGTELNAQSFFCYGLNPTLDAEPEPITLTAGNKNARSRGLAKGTVIAALGGGIVEGKSVPFVAQILESDGESVVLDEVPDEDFNGAYVANPPKLLLVNSGLNAVHAYFEGLHEQAIQLQQGGKISVLDLKISGGVFSARRGYAISGDGRVEVSENPRTEGNKWIKGLVEKTGTEQP